VRGHWEDFFGNDPHHPQSIRLLDEQGMVKKTRDNLPADATLFMPVPFAEIPLPTPDRSASKSPRLPPTCGE
jgi:hypothetical protein